MLRDSESNSRGLINTPPRHKNRWHQIMVGSYKGIDTHILKGKGKENGIRPQKTCKGRATIQSEGAEQVWWVRLQMVGQKDIPPEGAEQVWGQITNHMAKGERTCSLKMQSRYDGSDHKWHGKGS
jgi:hypothetical protein